MIGRQKELKQLVEQISICNTVLIGAAGTGKTSLINALVNQYSDKFKPILLINGRELSDSFDAEFRIWKYIREHSPNTGRRPLVIIDGLDEIPLSSSSPSIFLDGLARSSECHFIASTRPNSHTLFSTAMPLDDFRVIELKGFTQQEIFFFLAQSHMDCSTQQVNKLAHLSNGNPLILSVLVNQLKAGMLSWDELSTALNEFQASGLVHPNGNTIIPSSKASRSIISDVTFTNKQIWNELQNHPELLRDLPPRKFEEMVAEMLEKQGYSVELTPSSRDGGFDIYVASKQPLGHFLYLVECKRYVPPNKVGVHLVRALYGVVQKMRANAGMLVTTSFFTKGAIEFADETQYTMHLHDFISLKKWLNLK